MGAGRDLVSPEVKVSQKHVVAEESILWGKLRTGKFEREGERPGRGDHPCQTAMILHGYQMEGDWGREHG